MSYSRGLAAVPPPPTGKAAVLAPYMARIAATIPTAAPTVTSAPVVAPVATVNPWSFVEPGCVDYHYAEVGIIPTSVPSGTVLVVLLSQVSAPKADVDRIIAAWHGLGPLFGVGNSTQPALMSRADFIGAGSTVVAGGGYAGTTLWAAMRTKVQLDARAVQVTQPMLQLLQNFARGQGWRFNAVPGYARASGASEADLAMAVFNALGSIEAFGAAFNIMFTVIGLPARAAEPLRVFTTPGGVLGAGIEMLSRGPADAVSAVEAARQAVATANAQIGAVPDPDIGQIVGWATSVLTEQRQRLSNDITALQNGATVTMPPASGLDAAIAAMRTSVQNALLSSNAQLRSASDTLRRYAQCQAQKAAEPAAMSAISGARGSIAYFAANVGRQAEMPAVITQLQDALTQIDAIERDLNVSALRRNFAGLPLWGWLAIGATALLGGAVVIRVVKGRHRRAAAAATPAAVKANRRRRQRHAYA